MMTFIFGTWSLWTWVILFICRDTFNAVVNGKNTNTSFLSILSYDGEDDLKEEKEDTEADDKSDKAITHCTRPQLYKQVIPSLEDINNEKFIGLYKNSKL